MVEYIMFAYNFFVIQFVAAFGIGTFFLAISTTKELQRILLSVNNKAKENGSQSRELCKLLSEFIQPHAAIKQLSKFKEENQGLLF